MASTGLLKKLSVTTDWIIMAFARAVRGGEDRANSAAVWPLISGCNTRLGFTPEERLADPAFQIEGEPKKRPWNQTKRQE
jgi:hypothetical protein